MRLVLLMPMLLLSSSLLLCVDFVFFLVICVDNVVNCASVDNVVIGV